MTRVWAAYKRLPRRIKFLIVLVPLVIGGMVLNAAQPSPDNVEHKPAMCQRIVWNTTTGQYVVINYAPSGGGGCK